MAERYATDWDDGAAKVSPAGHTGFRPFPDRTYRLKCHLGLVARARNIHDGLFV